MPSTISAARAALHQKLADAPKLGAAGVQVTYGPPDASEEAEVVALLGLVDADESWSALGAASRDETFGLVLRLKVHDPAGDPASVDARGFALADAVRATVHAIPPTLDGTVMVAHVTSQTSEGVQPAVDGAGNHAGWVIFIDLIVSCRARIT